MGQNLENLREKRANFQVNFIFVNFLTNILDFKWWMGAFCFFFLNVKKADNGSAFWKDTFHFFVTKKVRSKKTVHYKREWEKYTIWSDFSGEGSFWQNREGGILANRPCFKDFQSKKSTLKCFCTIKSQNVNCSSKCAYKTGHFFDSINA